VESPECVSTQAHSAGAVTARAAGASVVQVESSRLVPLIVVLAVLAGCSAALSALAWHDAVVAEREARLLQYYLLELDAKFIGAGLKKPDDAISKQLKEKDK